MSNARLKFLRNEVIEEITARRVREYEAKTGQPVTLPVPVEQIVETVLGLDFDWDEIEEMPGEQILGGLDAVNRKVLLNAKHTDLFEKTPGLLRSTIGHEAGHWDVDIDRSKLFHPTIPGLDLKPCVVKRHVTRADRFIEVLERRAATDERAYKLLKKLTEGQDSPEVKSGVDRYQSALLMPEWLMRDAARQTDLPGGLGGRGGVRELDGRGEGLHGEVAPHAAGLRRHRPGQHDHGPGPVPPVPGHVPAGVAVHLPQRRGGRRDGGGGGGGGRGRGAVGRRTSGR